MIDVEPAPISAVSIAGSSQASVPAGISWRALLMAAWLVGAALGLLRLAAGMLWATWITRRAAPISDPTWTAALDAAAETLGVGARVALLQSERTSVPVTSGILKPTILLPPGWREWPLERTRVALMHELAHVKRRDALVLVLGRVAAALHWFNPLVHVAVARLRIEQEYACDDLVLATGADAPGYADALLGFAGGVRAETSPAWAMLSMARPSQVAGRVSAILDGRHRRRAVSRRAGFLAAGLACAIVLPLGALELSAADRRPAVPAVDAPSLVRSIPSAAQASGSGVITGRITGRPVSVLLAAQDAAATQGDTLAQENTRRRVATALTTALQDDDADVRQEALNALIDLRDPAAIPGLLTALRDQNVEARGRAVAGLARFDTPEAIDGLASALRDESPVVRARAALAFGNVRSTEAVTALLPLLDDADADVRRQAVRALGRIADPGAIDGLTGALQDPEPAVREEAARALGRVARGPEDAAGERIRVARRAIEEAERRGLAVRPAEREAGLAAEFDRLGEQFSEGTLAEQRAEIEAEFEAFREEFRRRFEQVEPQP